MANNNPLKKGTIYLHGMQSRFHDAVTQALNLDPDDKKIKFDITIDLIRSLLNKEVIYRIDYIYNN